MGCCFVGGGDQESGCQCCHQEDPDRSHQPGRHESPRLVRPMPCPIRPHVASSRRLDMRRTAASLTGSANISPTDRRGGPGLVLRGCPARRSVVHTSELPPLMRISCAVLCLKKHNSNYNYINDILY